ncbi:ATP-binding protein [Coprothermobacteraceae bacterium]|nr:ATP-binding protein [Coprothermobacteraceae bacterium]
MRPFWEVAIPHEDVSSGSFTMDTFAADLWAVHTQRAPEEYRDPKVFFERTYETKGIQEVAQLAFDRIQGKPRDAVVQLQTPFGGGKTHTLIYVYHRSKEWGAKTFVFSGDKFGADDRTIWEELEFQLTGKVERFAGKTPPGGQKIIEFLAQHQPLVMLIDELHDYLVKAQGAKVGDSTLATQTLVFVQDLVTAIRQLDRAIAFLSLPASSPYPDEASVQILESLKRVVGRVEMVFSPVADEEVSSVIRRRLFKSVKEKEAEGLIKQFVDYAGGENLLPQGIEKGKYRDMFMQSFPFQPEVIDTLYTRWGSLPNFQRTRGVLRLLALVVYNLIHSGSRRPYIRLADFDLDDRRIREELVKYIGQEYESVIASDISSERAGAKRVDELLGSTYKPYRFGTAAATTIFMYSFSGRLERGATIQEIKLSACEVGQPASIVVEALDKLKEHLFYLSDSGWFFTNRPNLNKVMLDKMDGITEEEVKEFERQVLVESLNRKFANYLWPERPADVPDDESLKLIILRRKDEELMQLIRDNVAQVPRRFRNTLIFLCGKDDERVVFTEKVKRALAWKMVEADRSLTLTQEQRKDVGEKVRSARDDARHYLRNVYRLVLLPGGSGFEEVDLGIATYGDTSKIDEQVYNALRSQSKIVETLSPKLLFDKYLGEQNFVETAAIYRALLSAPGELRITSKRVLEEAIRKGVKEEIFGLGRKVGPSAECKHFGEDCEVRFDVDEVIIQRESCKTRGGEGSSGTGGGGDGTKGEDGGGQGEGEGEIHAGAVVKELELDLDVPVGSFSAIAQIVPFMKLKFTDLEIHVRIVAHGGSLTNKDYEDKVIEALKLANIKIVKEEKSTSGPETGDDPRTERLPFN